MSTWRSKLCAFLSLVSPLFTQASLCWISGHPGTHLSLSLSLSTGFLGFIPDVFNLDLCPPGDSAFPPFLLLFPFPYLCKWCAWALPLVFSCMLSSSWVYSSYLFLSLQNCLTTFQIHFLNICDYICMLSSWLSILSFYNACLFCHSDIYCIFLLKAGSFLKRFLVWRFPVWIKGVGPFEPNLWSVISGYAIKMNASFPSISHVVNIQWILINVLLPASMLLFPALAWGKEYNILTNTVGDYPVNFPSSSQG